MLKKILDYFTLNKPSSLPDNSKASIEDYILHAREVTGILDPLYPPYKNHEYGLLSENEVDLLTLKYRLNPINVSDIEKRLITLKAAYYDYVKINPKLILIDEKTIGYYNYFQSQLGVDDINKGVIDRQKIKIDYEYGDDTLKYFTSMVKEYNKMLTSKRILPFIFFIHRYSYQATGNIRIHNNILDKLMYITRQHITTYCYLFDETPIADYTIVDDYSKTNIEIIKSLLSNKKFDLNKMAKSEEPKLWIVKS